MARIIYVILVSFCVFSLSMHTVTSQDAPAEEVTEDAPAEEVAEDAPTEEVTEDAIVPETVEDLGAANVTADEVVASESEVVTEDAGDAVEAEPVVVATPDNSTEPEVPSAEPKLIQLPPTNTSTNGSAQVIQCYDCSSINLALLDDESKTAFEALIGGSLDGVSVGEYCRDPVKAVGEPGAQTSECAGVCLTFIHNCGVFRTCMPSTKSCGLLVHDDPNVELECCGSDACNDDKVPACDTEETVEVDTLPEAQVSGGDHAGIVAADDGVLSCFRCSSAETNACKDPWSGGKVDVINCTAPSASDDVQLDSQSGPRCFKAQHIKYDAVETKETTVIERGCAYSSKKWCGYRDTPATGRGLECFCDGDKCNTASTFHSLSAATLLCALIVYFLHV